MFRLIPALRVPTLSSQNGDSDVMGEDGNDEERNINMVVRMDDSSESDNSDDDRLGEIARVWRNRNDSAGTGISVPSDPALSEETPSGRVAGEGDGNDVEIYSISTWSSCSSSSSSSSTSTSVVSSDSSGPVTHNNNNEEEENEAEWKRFFGQTWKYLHLMHVLCVYIWHRAIFSSLLHIFMYIGSCS